ncbi:secreted protein [Candidatus Magnetoovum chiemensis]|nr:secreted protein [Candidatus Magnetoovum chiemensis]
MNSSLLKIIAGITIIFVSAAVYPSSAHSSCLIYDALTLPSKPILLNAQFKNMLTPKGGSLVNFYVNDKLIGKTLTGLDGYAYLEYAHNTASIISTTVKGNNDTCSANLLIIKPTDSVIVLDIENTLMRNSYKTFAMKLLNEKPINDKSNDNSKEILKNLALKYPIIYVVTLFGIDTVRHWLKKNQYPSSVVLSYDNGNVFEELKDKTIQIAAIIGSPEFIQDSEEYSKLRLTFDDYDDDDLIVDDWEDIEKKLTNKHETNKPNTGTNDKHKR